MRSKHNLIFIVSCMGKGGAQRVISNLSNYLCDKYHITIVLLFSSEVDYFLDKRIKLIDLSNKKQNKLIATFLLFARLRSFFSTYKNESLTVISFLTKVNLISILSNIGLSNRLIISERNDPKNDNRNFLIRLGTFILYPLTEKIIFQTKYAQEQFPKRIQNISKVIGNPVILPNLPNKKISNNNIVSVGRLIPQKNQMLLINAFAKIESKYPNTKLIIYGEGSLRERLENRIKELNLEEKILLPGLVENINDKIANSLAFVLTSDFEGQSNALLEAMSLGLPCVVTNCSGVDELINDQNGILIQKGNQNELINALELLINNPEERNKMGKNARDSMDKLVIKEISNEWEQIF